MTHLYSLGEQMIEDGKITEENLQDALDIQKDYAKQGIAKMLGEILVEQNFCKEEDIARALSKTLKVPFVDIKKGIDEKVLNKMSPEMVQKYEALPIGYKDGNLIVAMKNPKDIESLDNISIMTGENIKPVITVDKDLEEKIKELFGEEEDVNKKEDEVDELLDRHSEAEIYKGEDEDEGLDVDESEDTDKPAIKLLNRTYIEAVKAGASDIHIDPEEKETVIKLRIDGVLHEFKRVKKKFHDPLISRVKVLSNMDIAEKRAPQDGRNTFKASGKQMDVRVASIPAKFGEKITMRLIDRSSKIMTLPELGFPEDQLKQFREIMNLPYGFILATGPTGSGKSTTLYAVLSEINSQEKHTMTVEDPVEKTLSDINQIQVNPRAGLTFASGLRSLMRNDPDIIMVGEIRDEETARIAVESALTGHLVVSTLHTNDSAGAVTRLGDMGIEPYLISSSLVGVVAQRLLRKLCSNCKEPYEIGREELEKSAPEFPFDEGVDKYTLYKGVGCKTCNYTGFKGRQGVYELLIITENLKRIILKQPSAQEVLDAAVDEGLVTLRMNGLQRVKEGKTTVEEVMRVVV